MATKRLRRRDRIRKGIRQKISGTPERPRLSVFKSNKNIYAQLVDDIKGHTLAAASSRGMEVSNATIETSKNVGTLLAEKAKEAGIVEIVFDRGGYKYHGQVKALAEGVRDGGLKF